jgi:hypothetical protein
MNTVNTGKTLLMLLPFWAPLIPPMGISCLKSFLRRNGCDVKTEDANIDPRFREIYNLYFDTLNGHIPADKKGNFYSIGHDVFHNHLMAHLNYDHPEEYIELVKVLIARTFYCDVDDSLVVELNRIVENLYERLESYITGILDAEQPTLMGLSVCSGTLAPSLFAFKLAKKLYPQMTTAMGGGIFCDQFAVGTPNFEILLKETGDYIDKFIVGEGEILLLKLLRGELPQSQRVYSFKDINHHYLDLAAVDIPDFQDFDISHYPYLSNFSSRSCPFGCNFCSDTVMWGKYRKKSPEQIVRELTRLYETHGYQLFMMTDLLLNPVVTGLSKEFEKSDIALYWDGCLRAGNEACDPENTMLWRRGGFYRARIGAESGSPRVLELMDKRVSLQQLKSSISNLARAGIQITTYWVIGFPGETEEDFQQTLDLIEELKDEIYEAECRPFYYYVQGQANSDEWSRMNKSISLYPPSSDKMLLFQTRVLDCEPSREETYRRVNRFVAHCKEHGIPNPYTLKDIHDADMRWKRLHQNAVPSLLELRNKDIYVDECKNEASISLVHDTIEDEGDFIF